MSRNKEKLSVPGQKIRIPDLILLILKSSVKYNSTTLNASYRQSGMRSYMILLTADKSYTTKAPITLADKTLYSCQRKEKSKSVIVTENKGAIAFLIAQTKFVHRQTNSKEAVGYLQRRPNWYVSSENIGKGVMIRKWSDR